MEQNLLSNKWVRNMVITLLSVVSLSIFVGVVGAVKSWNENSSTDKKPEITVSGKGEALAIPDIATFSFSVTEDAKTVKEAQDLATAKINKAISFLKDSKIDEKDIKTVSYYISPKYEYQRTTSCPISSSYCPSKSVLVGYTVSQSISVKIRDVSKSGTILSGVGGFEVQNVSGINFTIDDEDSINETARANAINDAKSKAEKLAKELGVKLVRITNFSEGYASRYMYDSYAAGKTMEAMSVSSEMLAPAIPVGENTVTSNVSITYEVR